ncbi:hypothetical protein AB0M32_36000 [Streptomyces sp. NPDC051985]|uniref:hypothetical protein n=1 Tax=Streptomyces sp. NPDC051985 TaxID=3155807 RepID=UPI0034405D6B
MQPSTGKGTKGVGVREAYVTNTSRRTGSSPSTARPARRTDRVFFARRELPVDGKHPKDTVLSVLGTGTAGNG